MSSPENSEGGRLAAWRRQGRTVRVHGLDLFVLEAGPADAPWLLVLHGFPTFSYDFHRVLPRLAERYRVALHDHPGFGLSDKPAGYSYSLFEQAEAALGAWRELGVERGHLVAHDYGTSVATELLARRERGGLPLALDSVTLSNGSVLLDLARLRLSQRLLRNRWSGPLFARSVGAGFFRRRLARLFADPAAVGRDELDALWEGVSAGDGRLRLPAISRYLDERVRFRERWVGALRRVDLPVQILWGREDPVAVAAIAERLAAIIPGSRLEWLDGVGHYPMLEAPERWADGVLRFVSEVDAASPPQAAG